IQLPPLRERKNDIDALASYFIDKFNQQHQKKITALAPEAMELIKQHSWPGNIRELENVIEHAFVIETGNQITPSSLPDILTGTRARSAGLTVDLDGDDDLGDDSIDAEGEVLATG